MSVATVAAALPTRLQVAAATAAAAVEVEALVKIGPVATVAAAVRGKKGVKVADRDL